MDDRMLTTGQAARHCSVTADTVLKWIRAGHLPAQRTAGGHHRIARRDLERVMRNAAGVDRVPHRALSERPFRYCWEFNGHGMLLEGCRGCPVYQMRAQRCYEVLRLAPESGPRKLFCEGTCLDCDYYRKVHGQSLNVLVVSDDKALIKALRDDAGRYPFNLEISSCEYACSAAINEFRPDFAVVDCSLGPDLSREICRHLSDDPRIPFVRVVLAAGDEEFPTACDRELFARIRRPFSVRDIARCITETGEGMDAHG